MAPIVYILCSITSLGCAYILMKAYSNNRTRLLFWSSLCFVGIAVNNVLLTVDFYLGPSYDLSTVRAITALFAMCVLMYGLVMDTV